MGSGRGLSQDKTIQRRCPSLSCKRVSTPPPSRARQLVSMTQSLSRALDRKIPLVLDKAYERLIHNSSVKPRYTPLADDTLRQEILAKIQTEAS